MKCLRTSKIILITSMCILFIAVISSCSNTKKSYLKTITSQKQLDRITARAKDRLLMLDFVDERCMSCHMLAALLEQIAKEQKGKVTVYMISVAKNPEIAKNFNVTRRPYVVYVKSNKAVHTIAGLQPKETFVRAIERFTE